MKTTTLKHLLGLVVLLQASACQQAAPDKAPKQPPVVRVQTAEPAAGTHLRRFTGVAQAATETRLSFKLAGTLSKLAVEIGDEVKRGQVVATLEATDYHLKQGEATAGRQQAQAQVGNAEAQFARVSALYANDSATRQDLDAAELALASAKANLEAARKRVEMSGAQVGYTVLKAPHAGRVSAVGVETGENVGAGQTVLTLTAGDQMEVEVAVPESVITRITEGAAGTVRFDALPGETFDAKVTEVGVTSSRTATTYPVVLQLTASSRSIRSGMAAEVEIEFDTGVHPNSVVVAARAVGEDESGRHAWVAAPQQDGILRAQRRKVETGRLTGDQLVVVGGLDRGELVITAGLTYLRDGMAVRLPEGTPSPVKDLDTTPSTGAAP